jgi:hypothetical protein
MVSCPVAGILQTQSTSKEVIMSFMDSIYSVIYRKRGGFVARRTDTGKWYAYRYGYGDLGYFTTRKEVQNAWNETNPCYYKEKGQS